jgi:hypothetical protein
LRRERELNATRSANADLLLGDARARSAAEVPSTYSSAGRVDALAGGGDGAEVS